MTVSRIAAREEQAPEVAKTAVSNLLQPALDLSSIYPPYLANIAEDEWILASSAKEALAVLQDLVGVEEKEPDEWLRVESALEPQWLIERPLAHDDPLYDYYCAEMDTESPLIWVAAPAGTPGAGLYWLSRA
jgi:hypothetical protein